MPGYWLDALEPDDRAGFEAEYREFLALLERAGGSTRAREGQSDYEQGDAMLWIVTGYDVGGSVMVQRVVSAESAESARARVAGLPGLRRVDVEPDAEGLFEGECELTEAGARCVNCGGEGGPTVARPDGGGPMCGPCWRAELAHARLHFRDGELDQPYWDGLAERFGWGALAWSEPMDEDAV